MGILCGTDDYDESGKAMGSSDYLKSDLFDLLSLSAFCCLQRLLLELQLGMLLSMAEPSLQPRIEDNWEAETSIPSKTVMWEKNKLLFRQLYILVLFVTAVYCIVR